MEENSLVEPKGIEEIWFKDKSRCKPLSEEEAEKMIKRCTSPTCPLSPRDHDVFYEYEKKKYMGLNITYEYNPSTRLSDIKEQNYERVYDMYGNTYNRIKDGQR